mgnify:FL=1
MRYQVTIDHCDNHTGLRSVTQGMVEGDSFHEVAEKAMSGYAMDGMTVYAMNFDIVVTPKPETSSPFAPRPCVV